MLKHLSFITIIELFFNNYYYKNINMRALSDFEKLLIIFVISLLFMCLIIIFFHFFRKHRKDKLISKKKFT